MPAYRDEKTKTWYVAFYYNDWTGERKKKWKRGFQTKREALDFERSFLEQKAETLDMTFKDFVEVYTQDMKPKLRYNTWKTKEYIIQEKLLPYFGRRKMNEIKASDIIKWQNTLMEIKDENGNYKYSHKYLKTIQAQLSAILNHAVRLYELRQNPVHRAGSIGGDERKSEMDIWTPDEYKRFSKAISDCEHSFYAFEVLFWSGMRLGEMLALTPQDIDYENSIIKITKSLQRIDGKIMITPPKTKRAIRDVKVPRFLTKEISDYIQMQYGLMESNRIFDVSKSYLHLEIRRGCNVANLKKIRIHDFRHSHISMLINMGFTPVDIANRVGHENIHITMHYAHMFPHKQDEIVGRLEEMKEF